MSNKQLSIDKIELDSQLAHPEVSHKVLPQHEFSMLIVAPKGSGKTNFICNLLLKQYKQYFHKVLVCSPTVDNDEKWDVVKKTKHILRENVKLQKIMNDQVVQRKLPKVVTKAGEIPKNEQPKFDGKIPESSFFMDMNLIPEKMSVQQKTIADLKQKGLGEKTKYMADRILLIMDDQAGLFRGGQCNPIVNYVCKHRHFSSSLIIVTQAYKAIPRTIRNNCNALILFECPNLKELEVIYEEWPESMNYNEWEQVYKYATDEPFGFMYINNKFPKGHRLYKNFTEKLLISHNEETTTKGSSSVQK